jgi:hypothetical protein
MKNEKRAMTDEDTVIPGDEAFTDILDMSDFEEVVTSLDNGIKAMRSLFEADPDDELRWEQSGDPELIQIFNDSKVELLGLEKSMALLMDKYLGTGAQSAVEQSWDYLPREGGEHEAWGMSHNERDGLGRLLPAANPVAEASAVLTGLSLVAAELDEMSLTKEADILDGIIEKMASYVRKASTEGHDRPDPSYDGGEIDLGIFGKWARALRVSDEVRLAMTTPAWMNSALVALCNARDVAEVESIKDVSDQIIIGEMDKMGLLKEHNLKQYMTDVADHVPDWYLDTFCGMARTGNRLLGGNAGQG